MNWRAWLLGFLVVVLLRGGVIYALRANLQDDPDGYRALARNVAEQGGLVRGGHPTAYRPPLYPLLLAAMRAWPPSQAWRVGLLHAVVGGVTALLVFQLGRECGMRRGAWLAAAGVAVDPLLLHQSSLVMTETLATLLATVVLLSDARLRATRSPRAACCQGAALGLAILCRPTFLPWLLVLGAAHLATPPLRRLGPLMLLTAAVVLTPWTARNWLVLGRPIVATSHGGYTFWLANNPGFYDYLRQTRPDPPLWSSSELDQRQLELLRELNHDELALDRLSYRRAMQCIQERPGDFLWSCAVRLGRLWRLAPHAQARPESWRASAARYAVGGWYAAMACLAILGAWSLTSERRRGGPWLAGLLLALTLSAVHAFYWSNLRMRAPILPWLYLLAGLAASSAAWRWRKKGIHGQRHPEPSEIARSVSEQSRVSPSITASATPDVPGRRLRCWGWAANSPRLRFGLVGRAGPPYLT